MILRIDRYTIILEPESAQDIAFVEDTLRLTKDGQTIQLERIDGEKGTFRLETDLAPIPGEITKPTRTTGGTFTRPLEDFIDVAGSWDRDGPAQPPITLVDVEEKEDED